MFCRYSYCEVNDKRQTTLLLKITKKHHRIVFPFKMIYRCVQLNYPPFYPAIPNIRILHNPKDSPTSSVWYYFIFSSHTFVLFCALWLVESLYDYWKTPAVKKYFLKANWSSLNLSFTPSVHRGVHVTVFSRSDSLISLFYQNNTTVSLSKFSLSSRVLLSESSIPCRYFNVNNIQRYTAVWRKNRRHAEIGNFGRAQTRGPVAGPQVQSRNFNSNVTATGSARTGNRESFCLSISRTISGVESHTFRVFAGRQCSGLYEKDKKK